MASIALIFNKNAVLTGTGFNYFKDKSLLDRSAFFF